MRDEQTENILRIFFTFAVLKWETSSEVRDEQSENMKLISVTFAVLKWVTSSEVRKKHLMNMPYIFVTFSVFRYSRPVIVSSFWRSLKKQYNDVGVYVLKLLSKTMCTIVPFPNLLLIVATVILSFTTTLLLGRVSPTNFLKVKVWVEDSYVAIYLELEADVCATMPAGRSNNMSNINGNRANLQNFAPP